ncbi:MAG TPA: hypothetical protein DHV36_23010 [Desulfobacteraceae bacterium]|nr:hypothetical protein [Desulfobacteraceae bacterium]
MNDFLKNLRSSHRKEGAPHSQRKPMEGNFFPQQDRRVLRDRRTPPQHQQPQHSPQQMPQMSFGSGMDDLSIQLEEFLPSIVDQITAMAEHVEKIATINEMRMEAAIRRDNAVADFFENLGQVVAETTAADDMPIPPRATTSYASGTHYTKDDILSIISNMRDQGATFAMIAEYLREKGIPTFSGRGEWHAQTIHRLCK